MRFIKDSDSQFETAGGSFLGASALQMIWVIALCTIGCSSNSVLPDKVEDRDVLSGKLLVTGSSTVAPLVSEMAKRFELLHPEVRIDVQAGGSGKGIADARIGAADIGMASRALRSEEMDLQSHQIAADGVGMIVHADNPVAQLTADEICAVYTDQVNHWSHFGATNEQIVVVHKAEGRATLEVFLNHFQLGNPSITADVIVGDNEHAIKTVAGTPSAIGYVSIGTAEASVDGQVAIKLLPLGGVDANTKNVANGTYPMSRPLNLITPPTTSGLSLEFVRFCQSPEVHDLIHSHYFVPVANGVDVAQ